MRHGTDEACVPGHRAMDGHVIGRIAGARLEDGSPHGPRHAGADRVVALFVRRRQEYVPVISTSKTKTLTSPVYENHTSHRRDAMPR